MTPSLCNLVLDELDRLEGEIERLRTENEELRAAKYRLEHEADDLRRQFGEPHADGQPSDGSVR
jgi:cell division protein FtsB